MSENSFWDELDKTKNTSFWDELDNSSPSYDTSKNIGIGNRIASGAKSIASGIVGAIPDTLSLAYNLPVMGINKLRDIAYPDRKKDLPLIPSSTEAIDKGIDSATDYYTKTPEDQKYINEALKFGSSFATGGGLAKVGNKALSTIGKFTGNTNKTQIAGASALGGTALYLSDQGATGAESLGGGLVANLGVNALPTVAGGTKNILAKGALSAVGLGKNKLNLDVAKAAKELDVPLSSANVSNGKTILLADKFLSKVPFIGIDDAKRQTVIGERILKHLDNAYDSIINSKELIGVEDRIKSLYNKSREMLPEDAKIIPQKTLDAAEKLKSNIKTLSPSTDEKKLLSEINNITSSLSSGEQITVEYLVGTKRSLNDTIRWDIQEKGVKNLLKNVQTSLKEDIAEYGKKNPEWYKYFTEADNLYSKVAKREQLYKLLGNKAESSTTGEITYNNLSKILNDNKSKDKLQRLVEPQVFSKLEKLGKVSRTMAIKSKSPSSMSNIGITEKFIWGLTGVGSYANLPLTATSILGITSIAHLLTNKKTLDLAIKFAENATPYNTLEFSKKMKAITGYTPITLIREVQKLEQNKQEESGNTIGKRIEENKNKPKGKALNQLLDSNKSKNITSFLKNNPFN